MRRLGACLLVTLWITDGEAQNWHSPHPWRPDAVVDGRARDYNNEYFLHAFSYRHLVPRPSPLEDGIRGTAGSLTSDTLYLDFRYRQAFAFDNADRAFTLDIQRGEDFDGTYQRQLVGFRQDLGPWRLSLQGDLFGDKSLTDVYFGVRRHYGEESWVQLNWVLPDAYFNEKTAERSQFTRRPQTLFFQWHQRHGPGSTTLSVNHSPDATLDDRQAGVVVTGRQTRAALRHRYRFEHWQFQADLTGEHSQRQHRLDEAPAPRDFERRMAALTLSARYYRHRWRPTLGVRYFRLDEQGWFGRNQNGAGRVDRREPMVFAGMDWQLQPDQRLSPTVYLSRPEIDQQSSGDWQRRQEDSFVGKLSLAWHLTVSRENGAVLSIVPSVRLHRFAFGGGNVQLHWPL